MVRRVGFNSTERAARRGSRVAAAQGTDRTDEAPEIRRNWTRIVLQCVWLDLWLIALYQTGWGILSTLLDAGASPSSGQLLLFAAAALGGLISARRLIRLLRGETVAAVRS